jgi:anti-sigma B factor antagonist
MDFHVESEMNGSTAIVRVEGEVDIYTSTGLRAELREVLRERRHRIAVDMSAVDFIDATGLAALLSASDLCRARKGTFSLVAPTGQTRRLLEICGLDSAFDISESLDDLRDQQVLHPA